MRNQRQKRGDDVAGRRGRCRAVVLSLSKAIYLSSVIADSLDPAFGPDLDPPRCLQPEAACLPGLQRPLHLAAGESSRAKLTNASMLRVVLAVAPAVDGV